jgi:hypothetical protein
MQPPYRAKFSRWIAGVLVGAISPTLLVNLPEPTVAQPAPTAETACTAIATPLTPEEQVWARTAWQYFLNNYQPETGFTNSFDQYPSTTVWDMGNYLMALNAALQLNLIDRADFDYRLNQFLTGLSQLRLFEDSLPNKVYNTATGALVDYGNNPIERGIGWSALDMGRLLAALHVIRTCYPNYQEWIEGIVEEWDVARSLQDGQLYGTTVLPNGETSLVQEGRLGYEEYAARGYELWGYRAPQAVSFEPFQFVEINGVQIPVDTRNFQNSGANNYVVSESYILDGIEFGFQGQLADYAARVLEVQRRRYEQTGQLTAVTEDNIDQAPHFLYNTVYANGNPWATITDQNEQYPELRSISTKAAFGWYYLYPDSDYTQKLLAAVKDLRSPDGGGFYAGLYEETNQPNTALTGNTNGLILEILHYKARGNRPLIGADGVSISTGQPTGEANAPSVTVTPIPPVDNPLSSTCPSPAASLSESEQRYGERAWQYFAANYQANTGLVNDRNDLNGATLWGLGDYLAALHAARTLNIITAEDFDQRTRHLLGALGQLPLFAGQLPHRGYDTQSLQPVDYGGNPSVEGGNNPTAEGTGWSALDLGRLLAALHNLKTCHPEYTEAVDRIVLEWSYSQVIRDGRLFSARVTKDEKGRLLTQVNPETRLGYTEYAARAFQLWGFNVERATVGSDYPTTTVEGVEVPTQPSYTVSDPFVLYGLEFGFDTPMRQLVQPLLQAQVARHRRTGILTGAATTLLDKPPYVVHNTIAGAGEAWATLTDEGESVPQVRTASTAVAFALNALFPEQDYTRQFKETVAELFHPQQGYYEGIYEETGEPATAHSGSTNSLILQSLLYEATNRQPLIRPETAFNSPWWQAVAAGDAGRGLPSMVGTGRDNGTASSVSLPANPPTETANTTASPAVTPRQLTETEQIAAQRAWQYFDRNWNPQTGLVNPVDNYPWATLWDMGSTILGIHAARQLGLIEPERFSAMSERLLQTLETLPVPATGLPNKIYNTRTGQMQGSQGWSALDMARFLLSLHVLRSHYPEYRDRINRIVANWDISKLEKDGWLYGNIPSANQPVRLFQEGRLGYEQYAASSLQLWGIEAENALHNPPVRSVEVDGIPLQVDRRNLENSGATNYLTSDPYLLWGLELGWPDSVKAQVENLLKVQAKRFERTGILTAVNEDSLDRTPHFLYYTVYANGEPWRIVNSQGQAYPQFRFLSTKAAFAWQALMPEDAYTNLLQESVYNLAEPNRGYLTGRYENPQLGNNAVFNVNTNAVILESLLYQVRGGRPLAF